MAPPPPEKITLRVKVPPGHLEDCDEFTIGSVAVNTTIGTVRQQIQEAVPSRPSPERQRILYGGRALVDNEQTLADALNTKRDPSQTEYVVHLVVKGDGLGASGDGRGSHGSATPANGVPQRAPEQPQQAPVPHVYIQGPLHGVHHLPAHLHHGVIPQPLFGMPPRFPSPGGFDIPETAFAQHPGMPPVPTRTASHQQQHNTSNSGQGEPGVLQDNGAPSQEQQATLHGTQASRQTQPQQDGQVQSAANASQQASSQAQVQAPQQHQPGRPISSQGFHFDGVRADGSRVQIHHSVQFANQPLNLGISPIPSVFNGHHPQQQPQPQPQPQPQANGGLSALDRARDNLAEMRRMLEQMHTRASGSSEEDRRQIADLQQRVQSVNDYVDPFRVHGLPRQNTGRPFGTPSPESSTAPNQIRTLFPSGTSLFQGVQGQPANQSIFPGGPPLFAGGPSLFVPQRGLFGNLPPMQQTQQRPGNGDVTCYLLSGPQGPSALLYSPQHGTFTGSLPGYVTSTIQPSRTQSQPAQTAPPRQHGLQGFQQAPPPGQAPPLLPPGQQVLDIAGAQQQAAAAAAAAAADPLGPMAPLINHMWLLLRILIFAYFLLGSNMGWRRPAALLLIGFGFWAVRAGLFGDGGAVRRWWDGIMQIENQPRRPEQQNPGDQQQQQQQQQNGAAAAQTPAGARPAPMPTPEQFAQRLLDEHNNRRDARLRQLREYIRPFERAVALFFASLVPGIGEAQVRAREAEERRRNEEEIAARRRQEEERLKREAEEKKDGSGSGDGEAGGSAAQAGGSKVEATTAAST